MLSEGPLSANGWKDEMSTITIQISDERFEKLQQVADALGITLEQLVRANLEDLLAQPDDAFQRAVETVLRKNAELYGRLAA